MEWISVEDRLPDAPEGSGIRVLAYIPDEKDHEKERIEELTYYMFGKWVKSGYYTRSIIGVTHWMPLPDPPKEKHE